MIRFTKGFIGLSAAAALAATIASYGLTRAHAQAPVSQNFTVTVENRNIDIGRGQQYGAWTFDGTVPGPVLHVHQGDHVHVDMVNQTPLPHGIDIHAASIASDHFMMSMDKMKEMTYDFDAKYPGVFLYHCSQDPVSEHIANGMYGMGIVEPEGGWPNGPAHEVTIVQSEFYGKPDKDGVLREDFQAEQDEKPNFVVFNGKANQYQMKPIEIKVGELVRVFYVNAGPNLVSTFHIMGAVLDTVYAAAIRPTQSTACRRSKSVRATERCSNSACMSRGTTASWITPSAA